MEDVVAQTATSAATEWPLVEAVTETVTALAPLAGQEDDMEDDDVTDGDVTGLLTQGEAECVEKAVKDLLGPDQKVVSVEKKKVVVQESEVIMVNGNPITLTGEEGDRIKACLLSGKLAEYPQLLNQLLAKAGLLITSDTITAESEVRNSLTTRHTVKLNDEEEDHRVHEATEVSRISDSRQVPWQPETEVEASTTEAMTPAAAAPSSSSSARSPSGSRNNKKSCPKTKDNKQCSLRMMRCCGDSAPPPPPPQHQPLVISPKDGVSVVSGTLEELIHELVPRAHSLPSEDYQFSFLLSSRFFQTPTRLLSEVVRRTDQLSHMMSPGSHPAFVSNLTVMLQRWIVWFPMDFREESAMWTTKKLAQVAAACHPGSEAEFSHLLQTLHSHLQAIERHEKQLSSLRQRQRTIRKSVSRQHNPSSNHATMLANMAVSGQILNSVNCASAANSALSPPSKPSTSSSSFSSSSSSQSSPATLTVFDPTAFDPVSFAQELTRLELEYLCFLGPEELINAIAKEAPDADPDKEATEARHRAATKTSNLDAYVAWFNRLSYLVASTVCAAGAAPGTHSKKKQRVRVIEFWIEVARECINVANFNSLMAIISGLNMTPVRRLKRTWLKIQSGKFNALEHQMDPSSNFLSYRSTLKAAVFRSQGTTDKVQRVVIPFFTLLVKDLYFVNEGCALRLQSNGHLNFETFTKLGDKLREFAQWKDVECPYRKASQICDFLQLSPILSEEVLDFESYECENPEMHEEKERYKYLKHRLRGGENHHF